MYVALYTNRKSEAITRYGTDKGGPHVSRRLFKAYKISRASADTARLLSAIRAIFAIIRLVMGSHQEGEGEMWGKRERDRESRDARSQKLRALLARCRNIVMIRLTALVDCNSMSVRTQECIINALLDRFYQFINIYIL